MAKPRPEKKGGPTPPPVRGPALSHAAVGTYHQGFDEQLTQYDDRGWRATFYTTGMEHSADELGGPASATVA